MAELRKWEAAEEAKKVAAREVQERLKQDRSEQLAERTLRKKLVRSCCCCWSAGLQWCWGCLLHLVHARVGCATHVG
jgi:hypothetical protein